MFEIRNLDATYYGTFKTDLTNILEEFGCTDITVNNSNTTSFQIGFTYNGKVFPATNYYYRDDNSLYLCFSDNLFSIMPKYATNTVGVSNILIGAVEENKNEYKTAAITSSSTYLYAFCNVPQYSKLNLFEVNILSNLVTSADAYGNKNQYFNSIYVSTTGKTTEPGTIYNINNKKVIGLGYIFYADYE